METFLCMYVVRIGLQHIVSGRILSLIILEHIMQHLILSQTFISVFGLM